MNPLALSIAVGDYDRTRPLASGAVRIDGVDPLMIFLTPEEIFFRAFRSQDFDVCELSLSSYCVKMANGDSPYVGMPAFLSRAFRHNGLYVRTDRIKTPQDLKGKKVGVPEYQITANVWARAMLEEDYGVKPSDIRWVRGGVSQPGRPERVAVSLPADIHIEDAPEGTTISSLLAAGEIDGFMAQKVPALGPGGHPHVGRLFADPAETAKDYFSRTGLFPIMHLLGVRRTLVDKHPWLPTALLKAFTAAKELAVGALTETGTNKATLPFIEQSLEQARALMGNDFWPYGVDANRKTLDAFLHHHHAQGLSKRRLSVDELFHPSTYETFKS
ncbi:ABC transporter substrate-binding protein [Rhodoplanes roseus]|uniref:4,5-dihydroxyphthalate decarboxylase n=1 Tax=Rhodoplanes roseus TaxID=29409 RepID=A0A327L382_9BRAD|nr:ABC transporter substrate-binding protein [Rhodoplanes roseus]RAI44961.1 4,5-dihydroxyphthalate decarboxylase [Rhodoplanes roseus]